MEDKIYKITLSDETVLDNLRLNGNNFISSSEINESVFDGNCSIVTINDGEKDEVHMNMELVQITKVNDKYWFVLQGFCQNQQMEGDYPEIHAEFSSVYLFHSR